MLSECSQDGCTVGTTGQCLLNNDILTCPYHSTSGLNSVAAEEELLSEPEQNPSFGASLTLAEDMLGGLARDRYCTVIGIVGAPDSGKTAALVSMYLLLCHGKLTGFRYADSKSLMALDEISRGARRWAASPPEQMTSHTELMDDRAAGFLHLRIRANADGWPVDFLLPDLPGEWSDAMVDESRHERLSFIERADVVWLMVDGAQLAKPATRQLSLHRAQLYLQRLKEFFPNLPKVIVVVTRADIATISAKTIASLHEESKALGIELSIQNIASFSNDQDAVPAGTGIADLVNQSIGQQPTLPEFWPVATVNSDSCRAIATAIHGLVI